MHLLHAARNFFERVFPAGGFEFSAAANERLADAFGVEREIVAKAALTAEEFAVDAGVVAIICAHDFVVADTESGLAAVRAVRAGFGNVGHFPGARLVTIGAAGERADGADVDAHAAFFALEMIFAIGNDHAVGTAHPDAECFHVHTFVADTYAAETKNASRSVVIDELRPLFFGAMNFFFNEAAGVGAVAEDHVLQLALAAL